MKKTLCSLIGSLTAAAMLGSGCMSTRQYTKSERNWFALSVAGQAADLISTECALENGLEEGNTFVYGKNPSTERLVLTKAAYLGILYCLGELAPELRKKIHKISAGFGLGAATWNTYQIWQYQQDQD